MQNAEKVRLLRSHFTPKDRETRVSLEVAALLGKRRAPARQGWGDEKSGLFEHPAQCFPIVPDVRTVMNNVG